MKKLMIMTLGLLSCNQAWTQTADTLIQAAEKGYEKKVKSLIDSGADVNAANQFGVTPLMFAAAKGHQKVVEYLVEQGADVHAADEHGMTALMLAAEKGRQGVVKTLIDHGAQVNATNDRGWTAIELAKARLGSVKPQEFQKISKILVDVGATPVEGRFTRVRQWVQKKFKKMKKPKTRNF